MEPHTVVLKSQAPLLFSALRSISFPFPDQLGNLIVQLVRVGHIAVIESEVLLDLCRADPFQLVFPGVRCVCHLTFLLVPDNELSAPAKNLPKTLRQTGSAGRHHGFIGKRNRKNFWFSVSSTECPGTIGQ